MCGIAGILALRPGLAPPSRAALLAMAASQQHRGPDEFGIYRDSHLGLAHSRLSIIDLHHGQQPLQFQDENCWIAFNGEIFNHVELRAALEGKGHLFRTHSDTEVVIHAWREWGLDAFARLNGQWAIAIWDADARQLILSRDPLGICPLHLCVHRGFLYFGSEIKSIFAADASIPRAIDPAGMSQVFSFWNTLAPQGIFRGVNELEPGHMRTYKLLHDRVEVGDVAIPDTQLLGPGHTRFTGSLEEATEAVAQGLLDATRLRMLRSDVPVGSYLSGGLDSSLIAAMGQQFAGKAFQTFSIRFQDAEFDETHFQSLMVEQLGSRHHEVLITRQSIADIFPEVVRHAERPLLRTAPAPMFLLSRLVRSKGIRVVLTGEGADEMFAGYDLFREGKVRRFWGRQPDSLWRPRLLERLYPYLSRSPVAQQHIARQFFGRNLHQHAEPGFAHRMRWNTTQGLQRLFSAPLRETIAGSDPVGTFLAGLPQGIAQWDAVAQDQCIEIMSLLSGYLLSSQGDRMLLGNSVEGRFPFLDPQVIRLAHSLPSSFKLRGLDEKHVLKRVARRWIPSEIILRSKQPYRAPDALCFVGHQAPGYVAELLSESALTRSGLFDPQSASQLYAKCKMGAALGQMSNTDNMAMVGILSTQLLHHEMVASVPNYPAVHPRTEIDQTSST